MQRSSFSTQPIKPSFTCFKKIWFEVPKDYSYT